MLLTLLTACLQDPPSTDVESRLAALEKSNTDLQDRLDAAETALAKCATNDTVQTLSDEVAHVIAADRTLMVPSDYATIEDALNYLDNRVIVHTATVTIQIADSPAAYEVSQTVVVNHRDGNRIQILGNRSDPSKVVLSFTGVTGIEVSEGSALGFLDGVTVVGNKVNTEAHGIFVHDNAFLECGPNVIVKNFGGNGFAADRGGVILAESVESNGNQVGYQATEAGVLFVPSSKASGNVKSGYAVSSFGVIDGGFTTSTGNGGNGYSITDLSYAYLNDATATNNASNGVKVSFGGFAHMQHATIEDNVFGLSADFGGGAFMYESIFSPLGSYSPSPISSSTEGSYNY